MRTIDWLFVAWLGAVSVVLCTTVATNRIQTETDRIQNETDALLTEQIGWAFDDLAGLRALVNRPADSVRWTWSNEENWSALTYYYPGQDSALPSISECKTAIVTDGSFSGDLDSELVEDVRKEFWEEK